MDFFFSLGYLTDNGIVKNDGFDYEKYTFRSNLSAKLSKHLTAEVLIGGRYDTKKTPRFTFFDIFKATRALGPLTPFCQQQSGLSFQSISGQ